MLPSGPLLPNSARAGVPTRPRAHSDSKKMSHSILALLAVASLSFSGCSTVGEAVRYSIEDTRMLRAGTVIQGDGFSVRVPADDLLLVRNTPRPGFLSLRTSQRMMSWDGSYNVYPFRLPQPAPSLQSAWQAHLAQEAQQGLFQSYIIRSQRLGSWHGAPAWFHVGQMPGSSQTGAFVAASCLTRRGDTYYWIVRSIPLLIEQPDQVSRHAIRAEKELQTFISGIQFQ